jgi:FixJ family two-component response regulator
MCAQQAGLRVVFITGYADQELLAQVKADGHHVLQKPFPLRRLAEALQAANHQ